MSEDERQGRERLAAGDIPSPRAMLRMVIAVVPLVVLGAATAAYWRGSSGGARRWFGPTRPTPDTPAIETDSRHWRILASARDAYLRDKARLNSEVTLLPSQGDRPDSVRELKIGELSPKSPIYRAGFRQNDLILSVNGSPVSTLSRAVNLANELASVPRAVITIRRAGIVLDYTLEFE